MKAKIRKAIHIKTTFLQGSFNTKDRWECPFCRDKGAPECRFNLNKNKRGQIWNCRFCGMALKLEIKHSKKKVGD